MKKTLLAAAFTLGCLFASATASHAVTLSATGTTIDPVIGYDFGALPGGILWQDGGGDALSLLGGPADVTFTFLGKEAAAINFFFSGGPPISNLALVGTTHTVFGVGSGVLSFAFNAVVNGAGTGSITNAIAIYVESSTSVLALFNDGGGDADFDDMIVRIQVSAVPVPAALPLLLGGLAGIGFLARRRSQRPHTA